jgi:hypothetical protein
MKKQASILLIILVVALALASCRSSSYEKNMKKIDDRKEVKAKETQKQYDAALDRHRAIQTKKTRKQMKADAKHSEKQNKGLFGGFKKRIGCGH